MMENDDKLISQFMHANKHEIEDNGFSRRVIRQLPEHAKWMSDRKKPLTEGSFKSL